MTTEKFSVATYQLSSYAFASPGEVAFLSIGDGHDFSVKRGFAYEARLFSGVPVPNSVSHRRPFPDAVLFSVQYAVSRDYLELAYDLLSREKLVTFQFTYSGPKLISGDEEAGGSNSRTLDGISILSGDEPVGEVESLLEEIRSS
ncbi:MAG: hypothetical protein AAGG56_06440 [Pseudomonadota bacterium]